MSAIGLITTVTAQGAWSVAGRSASARNVLQRLEVSCDLDIGLPLQ